MRIQTVLVFLAILSLPVLAGPKMFTVGAGTLRGAPALEEGKAEGYYIWVDKEGVHLRWTADTEPRLYTGRIDTDRPIKEIKRVRENVGGWARTHGNRIVLFSSTVRAKVIDGIDLVIPGAQKVQILMDIDGKPPTVEQVFLGEKEAHPKGIPLRLLVR
jgi:hypothetical protein